MKTNQYHSQHGSFTDVIQDKEIRISWTFLSPLVDTHTHPTNQTFKLERCDTLVERRTIACLPNKLKTGETF